MKNWPPPFEWRVARDGYRWVEKPPVKGSELPEHFLVPCSVKAESVAPGGNLPTFTYSPLITESGLHRTFASVRGMEGILNFAQRFGPLHRMPMAGIRDLESSLYHPFAGGERLAWWRQEIIAMGAAINVWDLMRDGEVGGLQSYIRRRQVGGKSSIRLVFLPEATDRHLDALADENNEVDVIVYEKGNESTNDQFELSDAAAAKIGVKKLIEDHLKNKLSLEMSADLTTSETFTATYVPSDLLSAMWLQFFEAIARSKKYRKCQTCSTWFELSPSTARTTRLFCSDACKSKGYRQKQEHTRRLFHENKPLQEIAKALDSDAGTVKRWIRGTK